MSPENTPSVGIESADDLPRRRTDGLMRILVSVRIIAMSALLCTVVVGTVFALVTGNAPPEGFDIVAAIGGGVIAGAVKVLASAPI
jgi:hypothetical protein